MAENVKESDTGSGSNSGAGAATAPPKSEKKRKPRHKPPRLLPQWKVLLHNDDKNAVPFVVATIIELTPLTPEEAFVRTQEADKTGVALLLVTHKERAELYKDQFETKGLTVTIEPDSE